MRTQRVLFHWLAVPLVIAARSTAFGQECQTATGSKTVSVNPFSGGQYLTSPIASPPAPLAPATPASPPIAPTSLPPRRPVKPQAPPLYRQTGFLVSAVQGSAASAREDTCQQTLPLIANSAAARFAIEIENQWGRRITTERDTFHTGQHIKLHIVSPVDGSIDIVQRWPDGSYQTLYPDPVRRELNLVWAGVETVLPDRDDWFIFREPAGDIILFVTITGAASVLPEQLQDRARLIALQHQEGSKTLARLHAEEPQMLISSAGQEPSRFSLEIKLHQEH